MSDLSIVAIRVNHIHRFLIDLSQRRTQCVKQLLRIRILSAIIFSRAVQCEDLLI